MASPLHICIVVPGHCNEKFCFENILYFRYKWTSKSSTAGGVREQTNRLTHWHPIAFIEWWLVKERGLLSLGFRFSFRYDYKVSFVSIIFELRFIIKDTF